MIVVTRAVMWFRDDLRLGDHPALAAATRNGVDGVLALYVVDETAWDRTNSPRRAYRRSSLKTLADADRASNQHGWQWVAGCGTDAAPYFRIFNPVLQGKKFDPDGDYVRRHVPELRDVPSSRIHEPWLLPDGPTDRRAAIRYRSWTTQRSESSRSPGTTASVDDGPVSCLAAANVETGLVRKHLLTADTISSQFNGPRYSGNGGYTCGFLARRLIEQTHAATAIASTLRKPPPLDTPLTWRDTGRSVALVDESDVVIGSAEPGSFGADPPACPDLETAWRATEAYEGNQYHPFDTCFTCGTARNEGDGLRVFSGPLGQDKVAAVWTPHDAFADANGRLGYEFAWAAMDCPGGWAAHIDKTPMVLGRMTAVVDVLPLAGEQCIVVGGLVRVEGRKQFTNTALYSANGALLGHAEQIWVTIDIKDFS